MRHRAYEAAKLYPLSALHTMQRLFLHAALMAAALFAFALPVHAQLYYNDIAERFNRDIDTINYEVDEINAELNQTCLGTQQYCKASNTTKAQCDMYKRKLNKLNKKREKLNGYIDKYINSNVDELNELPRILADEGVQLEAKYKQKVEDKTIGRVKNSKYYKKVAPKMQGALEKVRILNNIIHDFQCPLKLIANALVDKFISDTLLPGAYAQVWTKTFLGCNINFGFSIPAVKDLMKRILNRVFGRFCFNFDIFSLIPNIPRIPDFSLVPRIPGLALPRFPLLPPIPTDACVSVNPPRLPRIPFRLPIIDLSILLNFPDLSKLSCNLNFKFPLCNINIEPRLDGIFLGGYGDYNGDENELEQLKKDVCDAINAGAIPNPFSKGSQSPCPKPPPSSGGGR